MQNDYIAEPWTRVAYQNVHIALFDEASRSTFLMNPDDPNAAAYMIVGSLDPANYLTDGAYEFKLVYDSAIELRWTQQSWLDANSIVGFTSVSPEFPSGFVGLGASGSTSPLSVLDGDPGGSGWWNSVGAVAAYLGGMPAYDTEVATTMELFVFGYDEGTPSSELHASNFRTALLLL
jgi:hypothetical protein